MTAGFEIGRQQIFWKKILISNGLVEFRIIIWFTEG
jgi:hypothetical protein